MARRRRSSTRSSASEVGKLSAAILIGLLTIGAAGFGMHLWFTTPAPAERDKSTLCPVSSNLKDIIVILLDTTDRLPEPARIETMTRLTDLIEATPKDALLEVRVLDPSQRAGRTLLTLCNPGDGKGLSEFTANPAMAQRVWRQRFREPLVRALEGNIEGTDSKSSPLLGTLQGIALERFTGANTASANNSYRRLRTDLHGSNVEILYIDRNGRGCLARPIDTGAHITFWLNWIKDNNGRAEPLPHKLQGACK
jgi:hypothetical protein